MIQPDQIWQRRTSIHARSYVTVTCPACDTAQPFAFRHTGDGDTMVAGRCSGCDVISVWTPADWWALVKPVLDAYWEKVRGVIAAVPEPVEPDRPVAEKACNRVFHPTPQRNGTTICLRCGHQVKRSPKTKNGWRHLSPRRRDRSR